jgi:hypothetical protein
MRTLSKKINHNYINTFLVFIIFVGLPFRALAEQPVLHVSDINSGPKTGNTDGVGSGAIVTIWGNNLGSTQGTSKIYVGSAEATAIYYWKNADGKLPGGPSDLSTYHKMQEIAFAIPSGALDGATTIKINVGGVDSNTLPFTVRSGGIKFIKSTGSDSGGNGSWSAPYATLGSVFAGGNGKLSAGDIVYSVGVGSTVGLRIGASATVAGTATSPISLIAYPNTTVDFSGNGGNGTVIDNWWPSQIKNAYVNLSKLRVTAYGNATESPNGINVIPHNRIVGLEITGPTVYGGYGGALTGTEGVPNGGVYLGLYIHHYGYNNGWSFNWDANTWTSPPYNGVGSACTNCTSVDRFQHLFYISNRSTTVREAYEIGWCHLTDNPILHGIHIYDMGAAAGWSGVMKIHDNVIKNQRGSAIDSSFPVVTAMEIYNNIIISDTADISGGNPFDIQSGNVKFYNNTVYGFRFTGIMRPTTSDYRNNIMVDTKGVSFIAGTPTTHSNNLFYSTGATAQPAWATSKAGHITGNPLFTNAVNDDFSLQAVSPAKYTGSDIVIKTAPTDFFGQLRKSGFVSIGAINFMNTVAPAISAPKNVTTVPAKTP